MADQRQGKFVSVGSTDPNKFHSNQHAFGNKIVENSQKVYQHNSLFSNKEGKPIDKSQDITFQTNFSGNPFLNALQFKNHQNRAENMNISDKETKQKTNPFLKQLTSSSYEDRTTLINQSPKKRYEDFRELPVCDNEHGQGFSQIYRNKEWRKYVNTKQFILPNSQDEKFSPFQIENKEIDKVNQPNQKLPVSPEITFEQSITKQLNNFDEKTSQKQPQRPKKWTQQFKQLQRPSNRDIEKPSSQFTIFCEGKKYIYEKFYPHLDAIQRYQLMKQQFEKQKKINRENSEKI